MGQRSNKIYYEMHSWCGVLFSILLFVISFSGVVALFDHELTQWERPDQRIAYDPSAPLDVDALVKPTLRAANIDGDKPMTLTLPEMYRPVLELRWTDAESGEVMTEQINPKTGEVLPRQGNDFAELLRRMHTDLLLPKPFGRYLIGFMGLVMVLSIVSGVVVHKKIFAEMFRFRINRSRRLMWTDFHKLIGVWTMPFVFVIALSGALLGLNGILINMAAVSAFDGDIDAAISSVLGDRSEPSGVANDQFPANRVLTRFKETLPHVKPHFIQIEAYGDNNLSMNVSGKRDDALVRFTSIKYRCLDGKVLNELDPAKTTPFMRTYFAVIPLHYALYGGFLVKLLYFVLGIGVCLMMVTGTLIWQLRKQQRQQSGRVLSQLTIGVCAGIAVATSALFYANKLLPMGEHSGDRYDWLCALYFAVWIVCVAWSFCRRQLQQAMFDLLQILGGLLMGVPVLNSWVTGEGLLTAALHLPLPSLVVDVSCLLLGAAVLFGARKMRGPGAATAATTSVR